MLKVKSREILREMETYVPGRPIEDVQREYGLKDVVKIASNENPYGCSPLVMPAVMATEGQTRLYPDGNCGKLREAISERLGVNPKRIIFGCGTGELILLIGKAFISEGDECITAGVTFSQYAAAAVSMGGKMVFSPLRDHAFDLDDIKSKITGRTKAVFLANPNNPTGTYFNREAQERFMECVPPEVLVVVDEAYSEFVVAPDFPDTLSMLDRYDNMVLTRTFSKIYGLASYRVGYGILCEEAAELIGKIRPPFNVTVQGQAAALAAYGDEGFVQGCREKNAEAMEYMRGVFDEMGLYYIPGSANFLMVDVKRDCDGVFTDLMKKGYIIRTGGAFGMPSFIRVSMGTMDEMRGFARAFRVVMG